MLLKCCTQYVSKFGKLSSGHRAGKCVFILIPKKGNAKECSNYCIIVLISHASKAMLKILKARLQQYVNPELPDIQVSQETSKMVWYSHLFKNFPHFVVIHIVKGFGIVNKAEIDVFLELSCFFDDPVDVGNLISGSSAFSKTSLNIRKFTVMYC